MIQGQWKREQAEVRSATFRGGGKKGGPFGGLTKRKVEVVSGRGEVARQ